LAVLQRRSSFLLLLLTLIVSGSLVPQTTAPRSILTIHVGKTGLFSGFGHEHTVVAPIASGTIDAKALSVQIAVLAKQMKVMDHDVSDKDRAQIQSDMLGPKVLDAEKYPEIRFRSSRVQAIGGQSYRVAGTLNLHGASRELTFEVHGSLDHYHGKTKFKQSDFGIQPVSAGGGTVKVKDELEIEFDVYPADFASSIPH
jgi:hypothetical protein